MLTYLGYCKCGSLVEAVAVIDPEKPYIMRQVAQALAEMAGLKIVTTEGGLPEEGLRRCTCKPAKPAFDPKNAEMPRFRVQGQINYIIPGKIEVDQVVFAESREKALDDIRESYSFDSLEDMPEWDKHTLEVEELGPLSQAEILEALGAPRLPGF